MRTGPFFQPCGGFTSLVHTRCDNQGLPTRFLLTGSSGSDCAAVDDLVALPLIKPKALLAGKSDNGKWIGEILVMAFCQSSRADVTGKCRSDPYSRRKQDNNCFERISGKLKQQRRTVNCNDKTVLSLKSCLNCLTATIWLNTFVNAA